MSSTRGEPTQDRARPMPPRNGVGLAGLIVAAGSLLSFLLLFVLDSIAHLANP